MPDIYLLNCVIKKIYFSFTQYVYFFFHTICYYDYFIIYFYIYYNVFIIFTILCILMTQIMYINFKCCTFEITTPIQRFLNWTVKMPDIYLLNCMMKKIHKFIFFSHNMLLWLLYHSLLYLLQCTYYLHNFMYINDANHVY